MSGGRRSTNQRRARQLALRGSIRQWLTRLHRWSGLVVLLLLLVASVTGVWLVFRQELDRVLNARLRVVAPSATRDGPLRLVGEMAHAPPLQADRPGGSMRTAAFLSEA